MTEPLVAVPSRSSSRWRPGRSLGAFAVRRLGYLVVVVFSVYTLAFFLLYALPGNPVAIMLDRRSRGSGAVSPEVAQSLNEEYGFDQPLLTRFFITLGQFISGDFGQSFQSGKPTLSLIAEVAPNTVLLALAALAIAVPASIAFALIAAWRPYGVIHRTLGNVPAVIASIPAFWLGLILLQVFSFQLRWFPSSSEQSLSGIVLPAIALAVPVSASLAAVLIRSLSDASSKGWVGLLQSRGLPWHRVYLTHIARNGLLPFVTLLGLTVAGVLVGTVITESVFSRSGLGRLLVSSVEAQDAPVVLAIATLAAVVFAIVNFAVDLLYPVLDPRVRQAPGGIR